MTDQDVDSGQFDDETAPDQPAAGAADAEADAARTGSSSTQLGTGGTALDDLRGGDLAGVDVNRDSEDGTPVGSGDRAADVERSGADTDDV